MMIKMRATPLVVIRGMIRARGEEFENIYLEKLTAEEKSVYKKSIPIHWIDMPLGDQTLITKAAEQLYPKLSKVEAYQRLAQDMIKKFIPVFFKLFLKLQSVPALLKKQKTFWKYVFNRGEVELVSHTNTSAIMVLRKFSELPLVQREFLNGLYIGFCELGGGKEVQVVRSDNDSNAWTWTVQWK